MATARLTLDEVHDGVRTHDLQIQNIGPLNRDCRTKIHFLFTRWIIFLFSVLDVKSHQLPLFGHFCCRLAAQPDCFTQEACSGELSIYSRESEEDNPSWNNVWGRLQAFTLDLWKQRKYFEDGKPPCQSIVIDKV